MKVVRTCEVCPKQYETTTTKSRFCSASCRSKAHRGGQSKQAQPADVPTLPGAYDGLAQRTEEDLRRANRLDTWQGQAALVLAHRVERSAVDTGSAFAALIREHRAAMDKALVGVGAPGSVVNGDRDDLAAWRARRGS